MTLPSPKLPTPTTQNEVGQDRNSGPNLGQVFGTAEAGPNVRQSALLKTPTTAEQSPRPERFTHSDRFDLADQIVALTESLLPTPTAWEQRSDPAEDDRNLLPLVAQRLDVPLLPTPAVNDMGAGKDPEEFTEWRHAQKSAKGTKALHGKSLDIEARLLPTPRASDGPEASSHSRTFSGTDYNMHNAVRDLLPTPKASNNENQPSEGYAGGVGYVLATTDWGQYAPAIERWAEIIGRPAPAPTVPDGKNGAARLNPALTEWMMGLPEGHVCDVPGLSRNAKLKACGNGVVPMQAAAALIGMVLDEDGCDVAA